MKYLFSALLFTSIHAGAQKGPERDVATAVEQLRQLLVTPDSSALARLVSDRLSYGHSSGLVEDKASFINALVSGKSDFVKIELSNQTVQVLDKTAIVRHLLSADIIDNNKPGTVKLHVLTVWQKEKNGWRLVARQAARPAA